MLSDLSDIIELTIAIDYTSVNGKPYVGPDYSSKLNIIKAQGPLQNLYQKS